MRVARTSHSAVLLPDGRDARYVSTGHLVFLRSATLMAVSFDVKRLEVTGSRMPLVDGILPSDAPIP